MCENNSSKTICTTVGAVTLPNSKLVLYEKVDPTIFQMKIISAQFSNTTNFTSSSLEAFRLPDKHCQKLSEMRGLSNVYVVNERL